MNQKHKPEPTYVDFNNLKVRISDRNRDILRWRIDLKHTIDQIQEFLDTYELTLHQEITLLRVLCDFKLAMKNLDTFHQVQGDSQ